MTHKELAEFAEEQFGDMIKATIDIEQEVIALGGELHADEEALLLEKDSEQKDLWGINLYPESRGEEFIEFDSMINVRPKDNNKSRSVENPEKQKKIKEVVSKLITE